MYSNILKEKFEPWQYALKMALLEHKIINLKIKYLPEVADPQQVLIF